MRAHTHPWLMAMVLAGCVLIASAGCAKHRNCNKDKSDAPRFCNSFGRCRACRRCRENISINGKCPPVCAAEAPQSTTLTTPAQTTPSGSGPSGCNLVEKVDFAGYDLLKAAQKRFGSVEECAAMCHDMPDCVAFSVLLRNNRCYLKSSTAGRVSKKKAVSGICRAGATSSQPARTTSQPARPGDSTTTSTTTAAAPAATTSANVAPGTNHDTLLPGACEHHCNPGRSWADSYQVGGRCYCTFGAHSFDHDIGSVTVNTPAGRKTVVQVCEDIRAKWGDGPKDGREYYNTVNCGHPPSNNAGDEDRDACPGRVDLGSAGCRLVGPEWDLRNLYSVRPVDA